MGGTAASRLGPAGTNSWGKSVYYGTFVPVGKGRTDVAEISSLHLRLVLVDWHMHHGTMRISQKLPELAGWEFLGVRVGWLHQSRHDAIDTHVRNTWGGGLFGFFVGALLYRVRSGWLTKPS